MSVGYCPAPHRTAGRAQPECAGRRSFRHSKRENKACLGTMGLRSVLASGGPYGQYRAVCAGRRCPRCILQAAALFEGGRCTAGFFASGGEEGGAAHWPREEKAMKILSRLFAAAAAVWLLVLAAVPVCAQAVDPARTGSITVRLCSGGTALPGRVLSLYRAADAVVTDGNASFVLTENFSDSGCTLDDLSSAGLAQRLADCTAGLSPDAALTTDGDGTAKAENLSAGLYLIQQADTAEQAIEPFLVTIPLTSGDSLVYDVDASPKVGLAPTPTRAAASTAAPAASGGRLPQTGQLWWPVPVLACAGVLLFAHGWLKRKNGKPHE